MPSERVALIDGTSLVFRAFHAMPGSLKTAAGLPTNAIYGFAQMFRKLLAGRTPAYGAVVFDAPARTFRKEAYPAYKAERPPMPSPLRRQLPWIDKLVEAHHYPILRVPGVEADDVIGTLCRRALEAGHEVWVVSGDKDFAQLVTSERVRLFDPTSEVLYDADRIRRKWGVRPEHFVDYLALVGDKVDGIPGVPGIGRKTAGELLDRYGSLDAILAHTDELSGRAARALAEHRDQAQLSRELATLHTEVEVPDLEQLRLVPPTPEELNRIYRELEFFSMLSAEALAEAGQQQAVEYFVCDTPEMARAAVQHECGGAEPVGLHVLFEWPSHLDGPLIGLAASPRLGRGVYFPIAGEGRTLGAEGLEILRPWLEDASRPKVLHECKQGWVVLRRHGVDLRGVVGDTALASYLVDPTKHLPHRLSQVAREYLHVALQPVEGVIGRGRDRRHFGELLVDRAGAWACHLADATGQAWRALWPLVRDEGLDAHFVERELPLSFVLGRMELDGVRADPEVLDALGRELKAERRALTEELGELAGRRFNPGSHKQLGTVLFDELGLPVQKRTKTGYSVAADVLERLRGKHPIVERVLRWRTVEKLINTYTDVLRAAIREDGRIHATLQQTVSASGRLISTEPDLQRTPVRTDELRRVREAFVASEGCLLVSADWSQMELRLLAHCTGDVRLLEAYRTGADVHAQTAAELFGVSPDAVSPRQREIGKTVNFATIYGQGASALAQQLDVSSAEARRYIDTFFATYDGVAAWRERTITQAYVDGYVRTLLGRRRYLPELSANNPTDRAYGERIAVNTPIQGTAADLCKLAMLRIAQALEASAHRARLVLSIHDELVLDVPEDEVRAVVPLVREHMERVWPLDVPLSVDVGVGATWAEAH